MNQNNFKSEITVIVPILNEVTELKELLHSLAAQQRIELELIFCDGGSSDGSQQIILENVAEYPFPVRLIQTDRGRGRQMNAGVGCAKSGLLLFLHADSRFEDCSALSTAAAFYQQQKASGTQLFAARFGLQFRRLEQATSLAWFYYEAKARLTRSDCIRGDQGFLLDRQTFTQAGGFDASLPFLEDVRLVETTFSEVDWLLLPAIISTSARRFEQEGLLDRQVLNAIIMNSIATGWTEFFQALPGIYHCHADTGRLKLRLLLQGIKALIADRDIDWQRRFWKATGQHVAGNAWQIFFWLDVRRAFRSGKSTGEVGSRFLAFYFRRLESFFKGRLAAFMAQSLVKLWLRWMLLKGTSRTD
jgi:rSAM/selenodomain-associated transferase 2